jgi:hypothetical protein
MLMNAPKRLIACAEILIVKESVCKRTKIRIKSQQTAAWTIKIRAVGLVSGCPEIQYRDILLKTFREACISVLAAVVCIPETYRLTTSPA